MGYQKLQVVIDKRGIRSKLIEGRTGNRIMQEDLIEDAIFQHIVLKTIRFIEWAQKSSEKRPGDSPKERLTFKQAVKRDMEIRQQREIEKLQNNAPYCKVGYKTRQIYDDNEYLLRNQRFDILG